MSNKIFPGAKLFQLKATHGMPLENALDILINQHSLKIDWVGFVDEARKNEWWDFQTLEAVENALIESTVNRDIVVNTVIGLKRYMLQQPHPAMEQK
jgi:alanyl-tRNA synthetase